MKYLLGTKEEMTQIFTEAGEVVPVTVVKAYPAVVTQVKTDKKDGYKALQFGFGEKKEKNISKAQKGHMKDLGNFASLKEFRVDETEMKVGDKLTLDTFEEGDEVITTSVSKGKGFQGVVKRHGFKGGRRSHGQKHSEREPGSIGATGPQRVFKGTRMGGRMGSDQVSQRGITIAKIDKEKGLVYVKGALPGRRGTLVEIKAR
jgi:large subunit ribosomal protein L3